MKVIERFEGLESKNALYSQKIQPCTLIWGGGRVFILPTSVTCSQKYPYLPITSGEYSGILIISQGWSVQISYYYKIMLLM